MFAPTHADVRQFFCHAWAQHCAGAPMQPLETLAALWVAEHPEWHALLADAEAAQQQDWGRGTVGGNPVLHLAMHLTSSEQCSIDQPRGIRRAVERLTQRLDDLHAAHHAVMEPLGEMLADAAASGQPPDGARYVERVQRLAGQGGF